MFLRVHPPIKAQNAVFAVESEPCTSLIGLILKLKVYLHAISTEY
jgi:hypothetical protein